MDSIDSMSVDESIGSKQPTKASGSVRAPRDSAWATLPIHTGDKAPRLDFVLDTLDEWLGAQRRAHDALTLPPQHCYIDVSRVQALCVRGRVVRVPLSHWYTHFRNCDALLLYSVQREHGNYRLCIVGFVLPVHAERLQLRLRAESRTYTDANELLWRQVHVSRQDLLRHGNDSTQAPVPRGTWFVPTPAQLSVAIRTHGASWHIASASTGAHHARVDDASAHALHEIVRALLALGTAPASGAQCFARIAHLYAPGALLDVRTDAGRCRDALLRTRYLAWLSTAGVVDRSAHERVLVLWVRALTSHCCYDERQVLALLDVLHGASTLPVLRRSLERCVHGEQFYMAQNELLRGTTTMPTPAAAPQPTTWLCNIDDTALERLYLRAADTCAFALCNALGGGGDTDEAVYTSLMRATNTVLRHALSHVLVVRAERYCVVPRATLAQREWNVLVPTAPVVCHFGVLLSSPSLGAHDVRAALEPLLRTVFDTRGMHLQRPETAAAASEYLVVLPNVCFCSLRDMEVCLRVFGASYVAATTSASNAQQVFATLTPELRLRLYLPTQAFRIVCLPLDAPYTLHPATLQPALPPTPTPEPPVLSAAIGAAIKAAAAQSEHDDDDTLKRQRTSNATVAESGGDDTGEPLMRTIENTVCTQVIRELLAPYCASDDSSASAAVTTSSNAPPTHLLLVPAEWAPAHHFSIGGGSALVCYEHFEDVLAAHARHVTQQFIAYTQRVGATTALRSLLPSWTDVSALRAQLDGTLASLTVVARPLSTKTNNNPLSRSTGSATVALTGADAELHAALLARMPHFVLEVLKMHAQRDTETDVKRKRTVLSHGSHASAGALHVNLRTTLSSGGALQRNGQPVQYAAGSWKDYSKARVNSRSLVDLVAYVLSGGSEHGWPDKLQEAREYCVRFLQQQSLVTTDSDSNSSSLSLSGSVDASDEWRTLELRRVLAACEQPLRAAAVHYLRQRRGLSDAPEALIERNPALASATIDYNARLRNQLALVCYVHRLDDARPDAPPIAVQRIYLRNGGADKLDRKPAKKGLGSKHGGVCCVQRGSDSNAVVAVCEGPETALSVACAMPALCVCTTFGTSNMAAFDVRRHWPHLTRLLYVGENDKTGAARDTFARAAPAWQRAGYTLHTFYPPAGYDDANSFHERHPGATGTTLLRELLTRALESV